MEHKETIRIDIPPAACRILEALNANGFEGYIVGGCVRDALIGRRANDWDITTSALPQEVKGIFRRTIDTGIAHGTVTVMDDKEGFEVTTYRIDGDYSDGRHPDSVTFAGNLSEDLRRRDFTINAMAYHPGTGLVDLYGGVSDMENRLIRCVGDPYERFGEDALRILRAVRFSAQLNYRIEEKTLQAICDLAPTLEKISHERIRDEVNKLLISDHPEYFRVLYETGITKVILPEFDRMMETEQHNPYHQLSVGEHTLAVMQNTPPERYLRWAALLHDVGKPDTKTVDSDGNTHFRHHCSVGAEMARGILIDYRWDNDTIRIVTRMIRWHDKRWPLERSFIRKAANRIGDDIFTDVLKLMHADNCGKKEEIQELTRNHLNESERIYRELKAAGECTQMKELAVNGRDLIKAGIPAGPKMGDLLQQLLDEVLEDAEKNDFDYLIGRAKELSAADGKDMEA